MAHQTFTSFTGGLDRVDGVAPINRPSTRDVLFCDGGYRRGDVPVELKTVDEIADWAARRPTPLTDITIWHHGGAMSRVGETETAYAGRDAPFLVTGEASWTDPAQTDEDERAALIALAEEDGRLTFCVVDDEGFNHLPHWETSVFGNGHWPVVQDAAHSLLSYDQPPSSFLSVPGGMCPGPRTSSGVRIPPSAELK